MMNGYLIFYRIKTKKNVTWLRERSGLRFWLSTFLRGNKGVEFLPSGFSDGYLAFFSGRETFKLYHITTYAHLIRYDEEKKQAPEISEDRKMGKRED